jgi:hypothetical protein
VGRNRKVGELHQEITTAVDRKWLRIPQDFLDVRKGEMNIAARVEAQRRRGQWLEFRETAGYKVIGEYEIFAGVRRGYDVGGPGGCSHFQHLHRLCQGLRSVIEAPENVGVNVDHEAAQFASNSISY